MAIGVFEQICRDIQSMRKLNISPINVSFNVAYEQFIAPKFVNTIEEIISSNNINGDHFEFELAENDFVSKLADLSDDMLRLEKALVFIFHMISELIYFTNAIAESFR